MRLLLLFVVLTTLSSCTTLNVKNDVLSKTDEDFTHGTEFIYQRPVDKAPTVFTSLAEKLPAMGAGDKPTHVEFTVGQHIYTPNDLRRSDIVEDSNPYAGWLFTELQRQNITSDTKKSTGVTLGIIGKYSGAEAAQKFVHNDLGRGTDPKGWDHQLGTEVGVIGEYDDNKVLYKDSLELIDFDTYRQFRTRIGNIHTDTTLGGYIRLGKNIPTMRGYKSKYAIYGYAGPEASAVARNIFYDGNTFKDSHSVDSKPLVGRLKAGGMLLIHGWELGLDYTFSSPEHEERKDGHSIWMFSINKALQDLFN